MQLESSKNFNEREMCRRDICYGQSASIRLILIGRYQRKSENLGKQLYRVSIYFVYCISHDRCLRRMKVSPDKFIGFALLTILLVLVTKNVHTSKRLIKTLAFEIWNGVINTSYLSLTRHRKIPVRFTRCTERSRLGYYYMYSI